VPKCSMCSGSMLVTTATVGKSWRKEPSLSSASATRNSLCPRRALLSKMFNRPPTTAVGSTPAWCSSTAIMEVVLVLPWVPVTATANFIRISSPSISARGITGIRSSRARRTSGLSGPMAVETTTTSAPSGWPAACPAATRAPRRASRRVISVSRRSEPDTSKPRFRSTSAIPLMPMPPTPTKCTRRARRYRAA